VLLSGGTGEQVTFRRVSKFGNRKTDGSWRIEGMLPLPPLYPITSALRPESLSTQVERFGEAGFPLVQFRGKPLDAKAQWVELRNCLRHAAENGGWPLVVVNDRADLAVLAAREGLVPWGLHLGQDDLPPFEARRLPGLEGLHIGTSTHCREEWAELDESCDHAGVGPFRSTTTKPDHAAPIGVEGLRQACIALRARGIAPAAIGGLRVEDAKACFGAGAESLAMAGALDECSSAAESLWLAQVERWQQRPAFAPGQGLLLTGSSGAGKSTLAVELSRRLGLPAIDLDEQIARRAGRSIPEIFEHAGETAFRQLEAQELATHLGSPAVVALGGGAWETESLRRQAGQSGFAILWLAETPARCWARAGGDPSRPLAVAPELFLGRHRQRIGRWSELPCVLPLGRTAAALAEALVRALD
jgi:thiamine-phosphate diphosphorylase